MTVQWGESTPVSRGLMLPRAGAVGVAMRFLAGLVSFVFFLFFSGLVP
jgi:hypothetical protein